jgi:hypothetical protein
MFMFPETIRNWTYAAHLGLIVLGLARPGLIPGTGIKSSCMSLETKAVTIFNPQ